MDFWFAVRAGCHGRHCYREESGENIMVRIGVLVGRHFASRDQTRIEQRMGSPSPCVPMDDEVILILSKRKTINMLLLLSLSLLYS